MVIEAALELIIPDNTAYTVLVALRRLGYSDLTRVERAELFRLQVDDRADPHAVVRNLTLAEVLFNPNKHRLSYVLLDDAAGDVALNAGAVDFMSTVRREAPNAAVDLASEWEAVVCDRDDDNGALLRLLSGPFGIVELTGIERAVAYRLYDEKGPAPQERLTWACRELLSNPYSQVFSVRPKPVRLDVGGTGITYLSK